MISTRDINERADQRRFQRPAWTNVRSGGDSNARYERTRGAAVISTADATVSPRCIHVPLTHMMSLPRSSIVVLCSLIKKKRIIAGASHSVLIRIRYTPRSNTKSSSLSRRYTFVFSLNRFSALNQSLSLFVWSSNTHNSSSNIKKKSVTKKLTRLCVNKLDRSRNPLLKIFTYT